MTTIGTPVQSAAFGPIISGAAAPVAADVVIVGNPYVGETIYCTYSYSDINGDLEGASTYKWMSCDTAGGTYVDIAGASGTCASATADEDTAYVVQPSDLGKYIKVEITPVSATDGPV